VPSAFSYASRMRTLWANRLGLGLFIVGMAVAIVAGIVVAVGGLGGWDSHAFWSVRLDTAYIDQIEGAADTLLYTPPVVIAFATIGAVTAWPTFLLAWSVIEGSAVALMAGPLTLAVLFLPFVATELRLGNIHALMGVLILVGFRWPGVWSFMLLTKVTPGIGLLWFAFRREWRAVGIALGVTAALVLPTLILTPDLWRRWLDAIVASSASPPVADTIPIPFIPRLAAAVLVLWWGARRGSRWVVPIATTLALPVVWVNGLVILLACIPLAWPALSVPSLVRGSFASRGSSEAQGSSEAGPIATGFAD
jgi:hypothetical protein